MANSKAFRKIGPFSNVQEKIELEYDFANDGGLVSTIDLGEFADDMIVHEAYAKVKTAGTSGGSATVEFGVTGDANALVLSTAVASLTLGAVLPEASTAPQLSVAAADKITMTIGTAALTAGKIKLALVVSKF